MSSARALAGLLACDARRLARDRFLVGGAAYIIAASVAMRWILPWIATAVRARWAFDFEALYPLAVSYVVVVQGGLLVGMIGAFLLLESRESRLVHALWVSPMPIRTYLAGACVVMTLGAAVLAVVVAWLIGLGLPPWPALLAVAGVGGLTAPLPALFVGTFAGNKVEAFAQLKFVSLAGLIPLGAFFLAPPVQYLACLFPPFWFVKAWWVVEAGGTDWWWWLIGGVASSVALLVFLANRFQGLVRGSAA